jgi:hypothetical protein
MFEGNKGKVCIVHRLLTKEQLSGKGLIIKYLLKSFS